MYIGVYKTRNKALSKHCLYGSSPGPPPGLVHSSSVCQALFQQLYLYSLRIITRLRNISLSSPELKKKKKKKQNLEKKEFSLAQNPFS